MKPHSSEEDADLRRILKRCSATTYIAAREFRKTGQSEDLIALVHGLIERYLEPDLRCKLREATDDLRLVEDLSLDSLTLTEIIMVMEDALQISLDQAEPRRFRTLGDLKQLIANRWARSSTVQGKNGANA